MAIIVRRPRHVARTVGAFTFGAAAGSLLALLYAPASGKVTRRRLGLQLRTFKTSTAKQLQRTRARLLKQAKQLRAATVEKVGQTREWVMERLPSSNGRHSNHRVARSA